MFVGTWWSLMPPIVAIALALLTKEVYLSLFAGCALGALLAAEFHPWIAFDTLFNTMIDSVDFSILMFMILLGMIVMLMQESGGTRAYGEWASGHLKSKRSALVTTSLLGALIFVDDYFNCLTVGSVMRPVTDKYKVSRAKLAYIIDATAAPVCIIAPISSWAAAVNSYVPAGSSMSGFEMFVKTIPFNLYAILTLYMVFFTSIVGFDFGLMKKHEENAAKGDLFTSGGEEFQNQETKDPTEGGKYAKGKVIDLIAPMVVMIATAIAAMIWTGHLNGGQNLVEDFANCSSSEALVFCRFGHSGIPAASVSAAPCHRLQGFYEFRSRRWQAYDARHPDFSAGLDSERYDGRPGYRYLCTFGHQSEFQPDELCAAGHLLHCNFYCLFFRHQLGHLCYFCAHRGQHVC